MKNQLQRSISILFAFLLLAQLGYAQTCEYSLDLKDNNSFDTGCFLTTGSNHTSAVHWEVKGTNAGPAHCYLEALMDFSTCAASDLVVSFYVNRTGSMMPADFVALEILTDKNPHWSEMLHLDADYMNALGSNVSAHSALVTTSMYGDIASVRLRLVAYSTQNGSPIKVKDGEFSVTLPVLPLELTGFEAKSESKNVALSWETAEEINVAHFQVERSNNARSWTTVGAVSAKNESQANYNYLDQPNIGGTYYYRLKMVDEDGSFAYSPIVSVHIKGSKSLLLYPVPARDEITIATDFSGPSTVQVFNLIGRMVMEFNNVEGGTFKLDINELPNGNYFVKIGGEIAKFTKVN